jgi:heat-inducible transcriptional repressor
MVLVLAGGDVIQQMLALAEPASQDHLSATADCINQKYLGQAIDSITPDGQADALEQDILKLVREEMGRLGETLAGEVYRDGLTNVLSEPEFAEMGVARKALRVLEERPLLEDLLSRTVLTDTIGDVQVLIGGEGTWEELRDCSMVLARYGAPGLATGALGVLGPIRMSYGRTISAVRFVSALLSELVAERLSD